jgi:hypothetical protein
LSIARQIEQSSLHPYPPPTDGTRKSAGQDDQVPVPHWQSARRELRWVRELVKRYRLPAPNQEMILGALEEEGWPPRIDDPLPRHPGQDSAQRLHDTIKALNRHQVNRLLVFERDGTGEGVQWRPFT